VVNSEKEMNIPHSKPTIGDLEIHTTISVLKSGHLESGEDVAKLENMFCNKFNSNFAIAVSSGFAAIHLSLLSLNIQKDDEVIIPSYTCSALLNPIKLLGAKPVIIDTDENSFNISISGIQERINQHTKAIIVPHIFGFPARIDELANLEIPIIEDCAQAIGGTYKSKMLGSYGDTSIFSFYASKMITSGGDGGMIITNDTIQAERIIDYRYYGHKKLHKYPAYNYRLSNLPAAIATSQLSQLDKFVKRRKEIANIYDKLFSKMPSIYIDFDNKKYACYYRYPVRIDKDIEQIKKQMSSLGIGCGFGVLEGMHQLAELDPLDYKNTEHHLKTILSLPIYPSLSDKQVEYVAETLIKLLK
jgi:perosamine synthetase